MTVKSWVGVALAFLTFGLFAYYVHQDCAALTWVAAACFGGGLLFAGVLIDPEDFKALLGLLPFHRSG